MRRMNGVLGLAAALSFLGALLFGGQPAVHADNSQSTPTPTTTGGSSSTNGEGSGGHTGG